MLQWKLDSRVVRLLTPAYSVTYWTGPNVQSLSRLSVHMNKPRYVEWLDNVERSPTNDLKVSEMVPSSFVTNHSSSYIPYTIPHLDIYIDKMAKRGAERDLNKDNAEEEEEEEVEDVRLPIPIVIRGETDVGSPDREIHPLLLLLDDSEYPRTCMVDETLMIESEGCLNGRD
jgi:hypothetical protein